MNVLGLGLPHLFMNSGNDCSDKKRDLNKMDDYLLMLKLIMFLIIVVLLAYLAIRFGLRRLQPGLSQGHIKVIQKVPLDIKGGISLVLIRIGERVLLLGASQGSITVLTELSPDTLSLPPQNYAGPETFTGIFSKLLPGYKDKIKSGKEGS